MRVRKSLVPLCIVAGVLLCTVLAWRMFGHDAIERYKRVRSLEKQRSEIRLGMTVTYTRGPLVLEEYRMADLNGLSSASYRVVGRSGEAVRIQGLPYVTYDVSSFFGQTVQDGIWELRSEPPRGDTSASYMITVEQTVDGKHGTHAMRFTDPHYWALRAGRQYHIRLEKNKPVPNILFLHSEALAEPRYERLVNDFLAFGSEAFRAKITAARVAVRSQRGAEK